MYRISAFCFILIMFLNSEPVSAQTDRKKEIRFLIDTCITIMKNNSVYAGKVNWNALKANAYAQASSINDPYELGPVMRYLYQSVDDFHGAFFYKDSTFKWQHPSKENNDSIKKEWSRGVYVQSQMLEGNIGYLRIPYMSGGLKKDMDAKAQELNDNLCALLEKKINGLVLDVRLNGGGAMFPMMLGVEQLLGPGIIGSFPNKKINWIIKDDGFWLDTSLQTSITPKCAVNAQQLPVVLLVGNATGSSGEFLTMSFKGRPNTILLGTPTAGYITSVEGFPVNEAAYIYLSTGYGADRTGKVYTEALQPDILLEAPDSFNNISHDEKVKAALKWLRHRKRRTELQGTMNGG